MEIKNKIVSILFHKHITWDGLVYIDTSLQKKINKSYISYKDKGFLYEFLRFLKRLVTPLRSRIIKYNTPIHVSLPSFKKEVIQLPVETVSIGTLGLNFFDAILLLFRALIIALFVRFKFSSNRAAIFNALSVGLIYYTCIKRTRATIVHFYLYAFIPDVAVLLYLLSKDDNIIIHYHEGANFIYDTSYITCDVLHHTTSISSAYAKINRDQFVAKEYVYNVSGSDIIAKAKGNPKRRDGANHKIGIYSTGYYARTKHGFARYDYIQEGIRRESEMFAMVKKYAETRPDIKFIIYIHLARGVETYKEALSHYKDLLRSPNIALQGKNSSSMDDHLNISLGMTVNSNVFWDRLLLGCKTILVNPFGIDDFIDKT